MQRRRFISYAFSNANVSYRNHWSMMTYPKAARISPESKPIAYGAAVLAGGIYLGAFASSFFGQASLARFMLIPEPLHFVVPAVVDLALILFTMATLVRRSRGESTLVTNLATAFWTVVSITANVAHVLIPAGPYASWSAGTYAGATFSALMPLAALGASLVVENVLIAPPEDEKAAVKEEAAAPVAVTKGSLTPAPAGVQLKSVPPVASEPQAATHQRRPEAVQAPSVTEATRTSVQAVTPRPVAVPPVPRTPTDKADRALSIWSLKDDEGLTWAEISAKTGLSVSTAKRRYKDELEERQLHSA